MKWQTSKHFKEPFYVDGSWDFKHAYKCAHASFLGADTETKLYYNNKLLSEITAYKLYKKYDQKWFKKNIEVRCYAFMLADATNFVLFQNAEDFLTACAMLNASYVFWYNARFDFAIFDYYFLTHEWNDVTTALQGAERKMRLPDKTYQCLNGDFGQRYQMQVWKQYTNRKDMKKVHRFKMVDICNISGGGLKKNLKDWDIKDRAGNDVRKLEMDYVEANIEDDIQYMINDTKGLYLLAEKINNTMLDITGYSLFKGDYMTAGGLAKKTMLKFMFGQDDKVNKYMFKEAFPIDIAEDSNYRKNHLYQGGLSFVNPDYIGKVVHGIHKHDENSMYPDKMRNMVYPFGKPKRIDNFDFDRAKKNCCYIVAIQNLDGFVKPKMLPIYRDTVTGDFVEVIRDSDFRFMWLEELQMYEKYYDLEYDLLYALEFEGKIPTGMKKYIDTLYDIKSHSKGAVRQCAKILLNSAYGKLAQRVEREICVYELDEETHSVHLVHKGQEIDKKAMLSVVVGSRVSALARVNLMDYIIEICEGNPRKNFVYCDTDSIHSFTKYGKCDPVTLGKMDYEGYYDSALYLAPKSYLLFNKEGKVDLVYNEDGTLNKDKSIDDRYEVHCKGVNTNIVHNELKGHTFKEACNIFRPNYTFKCLNAINVQGGKALVYVDKMIVNDEYMIIDFGDLEELYEVS